MSRPQNVPTVKFIDSKRLLVLNCMQKYWTVFFHFVYTVWEKSGLKIFSCSNLFSDLWKLWSTCKKSEVFLVFLFTELYWTALQNRSSLTNRPIIGRCMSIRLLYDRRQGTTVCHQIIVDLYITFVYQCCVFVHNYYSYKNTFLPLTPIFGTHQKSTVVAPSEKF